jgi:hypothetical protein
MKRWKSKILGGPAMEWQTGGGPAIFVLGQVKPIHATLLTA